MCIQSVNEKPIITMSSRNANVLCSPLYPLDVAWPQGTITTCIDSNGKINRTIDSPLLAAATDRSVRSVESNYECNSPWPHCGRSLLQRLYYNPSMWLFRQSVSLKYTNDHDLGTVPHRNSPVVRHQMWFVVWGIFPRQQRWLERWKV